MKGIKDYLDLLAREQVKEVRFEKDFVSYTVRYNDLDEMFDLFAYNMEEIDVLEKLPNFPSTITVDGKREEEGGLNNEN